MTNKELWNKKTIDLSEQLKPLKRGHELSAAIYESQIMALVNILVANGLTTEEDFYHHSNACLDNFCAQILHLPVVSPIEGGESQ